MTLTATPSQDAYQVCTVEWHRPLQWLGKAWADIERCPSIGAAHGAALALFGAALLYFSRDHFWWLAGAQSENLARE